MKSQHALDFLRKSLVKELGFTALDEERRTKAQYFRTAGGKVFGIVLGEMDNEIFSAQTTSIILEQCQLPPDLPAGVIQIAPYSGSSTHAPTKGIFLKNAQTRVQVPDEQALHGLLSWYARGVVPRSDIKPTMNSSVGLSLLTQPTKQPPVTAAPVEQAREGEEHSSEQKSVRVPDKGLLIREPWIEKILFGEKIWEMRSRDTRKRGWVALIKAGSGMVVGLARIVDCIGPLSELQMLETLDKHGISVERLSEIPQYRHAWVLSDVIRLPRPVAYQHKSGAVIFTSLDAEAKQRIATQLGSVI
ncbi:ASCH domain-containing protein [Laribacter hongkongensis]|uniref:ASCH domain-containing protein n=1 Tax=Laribacter hongkongensis TaxID=168471 RepID=UPI001EFE641F|nr:ASCH domain-containing protein [Laribacter hongkongensis]MCG9059772.1 ASCH domain-containing protein [Laribacter hongkongensis]MCG9086512.1 ASCH domain-containing protein [Laribacter hongkongensis]